MQNAMDNHKSSKMAKHKSSNSGVTPLMMKYLVSNSSSNSNSSSPGDPFSPLSKLSKFSGNTSSSSNSNSPLSAIDGEYVLVMDGILVNSSSSLSSSSSVSDVDSGFYKTELCRSWEDFGKCRFGTKCQFAHGNEELRPTRFPFIKNKSDAQFCKSYVTGSCVYGSKCRFVHHQVMTDAALVSATQTASPIKPDHAIMSPITRTRGPEQTSKTSVTPTTFKLQQTRKSPGTPRTMIKPEQTSKNPTSINKTIRTSRTPITAIGSKDSWSPRDDGIEFALPSHPEKPPSREEVDAYIGDVLYYPKARRRLLVFTEIFPD